MGGRRGAEFQETLVGISRGRYFHPDVNYNSLRGFMKVVVSIHNVCMEISGLE